MTFAASTRIPRRWRRPGPGSGPAARPPAGGIGGGQQLCRRQRGRGPVHCGAAFRQRPRAFQQPARSHLAAGEARRPVLLPARHLHRHGGPLPGPWPGPLPPAGRDRPFLPDEAQLMERTKELGASLVDPLKTTLVQGQRAMTTWVLRKGGAG